MYLEQVIILNLYLREAHCNMEKIVNLKFDKLIVDLTGNPFGRDTFDKQINKYVDGDNEVIAVIPDDIEDIGSSFIQGMYASLSEQYGRTKARNLLHIKSSRKEIMDKVQKSLDTYGV